jgi:hypothetical protein
VLHKVFHNTQYPSHLLLPIIPTGATGAADSVDAVSGGGR